MLVLAPNRNPLMWQGVGQYKLLLASPTGALSFVAPGPGRLVFRVNTDTAAGETIATIDGWGSRTVLSPGLTAGQFVHYDMVHRGMTITVTAVDTDVLLDTYGV